MLKLIDAFDVFSPCHQQQQQTHDRMVSSLTAQLKDTRQELREKQKEKKEAERFWQNYKDDQEAEGRRLRDSLLSRDKLIEVKCRNLPLVAGLQLPQHCSPKQIILCLAT